MKKVYYGKPIPKEILARAKENVQKEMEKYKKKYKNIWHIISKSTLN